MTDWRCIGCGGPLQNHDPQEAFYTPKAYDEKTPVYCERCYKIRHYGQIKPSFMTETMVYETLHQVEKRPGVMVLVTDALDFLGSIHPFFVALSEAKRTIVIVNKVDVLPQSVALKTLQTRFQMKAKNAGLHVDELLLVSALKKKNIDALHQALVRASRGQDLYLMGLTNVGKSSILNALLAAQGHSPTITTSYQPHVTQDLIPFAIGHQTLYDTPGLTSQHSYRYYLQGASLRSVLPLKEIKPRVYQHLKGQTFFIGGLCYLVCEANEKSTLIAYFSEKLRVHHRQSQDDYLFHAMKKGHFLIPPMTSDRPSKMKKTTLSAKGKKVDIIVPGLGFMTVNHVHKIDLYHYSSVKPQLEVGLIG